MYPCNLISDKYELNTGLRLIYEKLHKRFKKQNWWPADSKLEIIIGAILTQAVNWSNVEKAIDNLKEKNLLNLKSLDQIELTKLAQHIKPSGYYNMKAKKIKQFVKYLKENYNLDLNNIDKGERSVKVLKKELLKIYGIGPETADSILLYVYNKPVFVIDNYTKRMLTKTGFISKNTNYYKVQNMFHSNLKQDINLYKEFHALIVKLGKKYCLKTTAICEKCPIVG
ncbi:MAG: endonuclease III domain-containing protein [Halanaerobiales bacterium]|nr:endonuclease III domain-containing protein [Halanaerobiales bacterium]